MSLAVLPDETGGRTVINDNKPEEKIGSIFDIGLSFQVARARNASAMVSVRYSLRDDGGQTLATVDVPHDRAVAVSPSVDAYDIGVRLPAAAGRYVARIEATDGRRSARREVPVTLR